MLRLLPLVVLIFTTPAHAEPDYHGEAIATDAVAAAALAGGVVLLTDTNVTTTGRWAFAIAGYSTYALALPILHLHHRNPGRAAASFALRALLPAAGMMIAGTLSDASCPGVNDRCNAQIDRYQLTGIAIGLAAPILIDSIALSVGDDPPKLVPTVQGAPGSMSFGVAGRF